MKKLLAVILVGGLFGLGCSPSSPSAQTKITPNKTTKEERSSTGMKKESTELKDGGKKESKTIEKKPGDGKEDKDKP